MNVEGCRCPTCNTISYLDSNTILSGWICPSCSTMHTSISDDKPTVKDKYHHTVTK